jgi:hypothetical protein
MRPRAALGALVAVLAVPASAGAHTIAGLVHDARDVVLAQAPGTHARITADGAHLELRRDGAHVVEVLDPQGAAALRLDANGAWARKGAPIVTVLSVTTGAPDPRDPAWLNAGGDTLRFHYPGTHGEVSHRWSVPLRVDGRVSEIRGAVERVARPSLAWAVAAAAAAAAGAGLAFRLGGPRGAPLALTAALAFAVVAVSYGESQATGARPWGEVVAAVVAAAGLAAALRLRRDAALELGVLAVTAVLLALPLIGRLPALRHGVVVTTLDPDLARALVVSGLAAAAAISGWTARAWWPAHEPDAGRRHSSPRRRR